MFPHLKRNLPKKKTLPSKLGSLYSLSLSLSPSFGYYIPSALLHGWMDGWMDGWMVWVCVWKVGVMGGSSVGSGRGENIIADFCPIPPYPTPHPVAGSTVGVISLRPTLTDLPTYYATPTDDTSLGGVRGGWGRKKEKKMSDGRNTDEGLRTKATINGILGSRPYGRTRRRKGKGRDQKDLDDKTPARPSRSP